MPNADTAAANARMRYDAAERAYGPRDPVHGDVVAVKGEPGMKAYTVLSSDPVRREAVVRTERSVARIPWAALEVISHRGGQERRE